MPFNYTTISRKAKAALKSAFPEAAIETEKQFAGRVHVKIVSPEFNGKRDETKQTMVWDVLRDKLSADPDLLGISLVVVYGMDELLG